MGLFIKEPIKEIVKKMWDDDVFVTWNGGCKPYTMIIQGEYGGDYIDVSIRYDDLFVFLPYTESEIRVTKGLKAYKMSLSQIEGFYLLFNMWKKVTKYSSRERKEYKRNKKESDTIARQQAKQILSKEI